MLLVMVAVVVMRTPLCIRIFALEVLHEGARLRAHVERVSVVVYAWAQLRLPLPLALAQRLALALPLRLHDAPPFPEDLLHHRGRLHVRHAAHARERVRRDLLLLARPALVPLALLALLLRFARLAPDEVLAALLLGHRPRRGQGRRPEQLGPGVL